MPLALFAFGEDGLALAIAYFAVHAVLNITIGQALAAGRFTFRNARFPSHLGDRARRRAQRDRNALPPSLARAAHMLGGLTIPMMLMALGYSLTKLRVTSIAVAPRASRRLRLFGGFAIGWGVALALGLTGDPARRAGHPERDASAVYNYMFAARYDNQPEDVAGLVVLSTPMAIGALPIFLWTVM